jgi:acyl-CoA thioesterase-1
MQTILTQKPEKFSLTALLRLTLILILMLALIACENQPTTQNPESLVEQQAATSPANQPAVTATYTILALGDSLTEGLGVKQDANYPALLQQALHQQGFSHVKVVNSGLSGETSSGLKNRLDWVLQLKPDLTILNIGANDAMRGLPLSLTTGNIDEIIEHIQAADSQVILAGMQIYDNLGREYVAGFKDMYAQLAQQHDLVMIPFFLEHVAGDPKLNQTDMIHPNSAGYQIIVERNVLPTVLPLLKPLKN